MQLTFDISDELMTTNLAAQFARLLSAPLVLGFSGDLGAGKTTFIRAMLQALGIRGAIKSPTYSLVESYLIRDMQIHHFDLYRIQEDTELEYIGFRDYFTTEAVCCIEWPERMRSDVDFIDIQVTMVQTDIGRELLMQAKNINGSHILSSLGAL